TPWESQKSHFCQSSASLQSAALPCICNNSLLEGKRMGPSRPGDISHGGYDHFLTIGLRSL
ncbi:hypothetical protein, partial [Novosphingobium pokkalii]